LLEPAALVDEDAARHERATNGAIPPVVLDISALVSAVARLQEGLERHHREPADDQLRDGLIQRFEFTYERTHRILRRYLRQVSPSPAIFNQMPFQELIRSGCAEGLLLSDWPACRHYRDMRARTSHTYAAAVAEEIVRNIPAFLAEVIHLRDGCNGGWHDGRSRHQRRTCSNRARCAAPFPATGRAGVRVRLAGAWRGARRYSDLDLAVAWDHPLGLRWIGEIAEALSESDLPYKVDIIDLEAIDPSF
jgi:nucleotidyltransferase substrate binding protein (TIGR01987 family)